MWLADVGHRGEFDTAVDKVATPMPPPQPTGRSPARSSRGMALVIVMFLLMILSGLGAAMITSSQTELMVARNTVSSAQAQAAAEAGLNHATELAIPFVVQFAANGFATASDAMTGLVRGPDGLTGSPASDADNSSLENLGIPRSPAQLALGGAFGVAYAARVFDEDDPDRGVTLTAADLTRIGEDGVRSPTRIPRWSFRLSATRRTTRGSPARSPSPAPTPATPLPCRLS